MSQPLEGDITHVHPEAIAIDMGAHRDVLVTAAILAFLGYAAWILWDIRRKHHESQDSLVEDYLIKANSYQPKRAMTEPQHGVKDLS